ncbi:plant regulator RWP-RK family protein isoform X2 [Wolffia australiana]
MRSRTRCRSELLPWIQSSNWTRRGNLTPQLSFQNLRPLIFYLLLRTVFRPCHHRLRRRIPLFFMIQSSGLLLWSPISPILIPMNTGTCEEAFDGRLSIGTGRESFSNETGKESYDVSCVIKEKMTQALRCFKDSLDQHVLVQVWAPVTCGNRQMLTTSEQPFVLDPRCISLLQYRTVSLNYLFSVDDHDEGDLGLPGRVYCQKSPEWTPDVQYYSRKEYPRLTHALNYNVKGSLALPVFEPHYKKCVAVVELIMTSPKINYAFEVDRVCKALEGVNLKSSGISDHQSMRTFTDGYQAAMSEVLELLTMACETHKLPLGQTWVPLHDPGAILLGEDGPHPEQKSLSTTDTAFYVVEPRMWGFRDACLEHRLQRGQGVPGMAYSLKRPCLSSNITRCGKNYYPLVHYARMFGLVGCFSLCLRSNYTGKDDYIVEFFLPENCSSELEQLTVVESVLTMVRRSSRSLNSVSDAILRLEEYSECSSGQNSTEEGQTSAPPPRTEEKKRGKPEKEISLDVLRNYFSGSLKEAANSLGVCPTTMKRICRRHGISRWPSRKIKKVNRSISKLKRVIESVNGVDSALCPPWRGVDLETGNIDRRNSGGGSSGSSAAANLGHHMKDSASSKDKRSSGFLHKVKANYRGDLVRFSIGPGAGLFSVKSDVAKRLKLDVGGFDLKYLDEDDEWVLLACDADLDECLEFSGGQIIRLSVVDFSGSHTRDIPKSSED